MALEDLIGTKYINHLNRDNPLGSDLPDAGDDHLRGIKNTIKNTFPNITGPVTRTHTELNNGSMPPGTKTVFFMAASPVGWERVTGITEEWGIRIVRTSLAGAGSGGSSTPFARVDQPVSHFHNPTAATNRHYHEGPVLIPGDEATSGSRLAIIHTAEGENGLLYDIENNTQQATDDHYHEPEVAGSAAPVEWRYRDFILCVRSAIA